MDIGIDESLLETRPELSKVINAEEIDNYLERIQNQLPNVDFSSIALKRRNEKLVRLEAQIQRAKASIYKWEKMLNDIRVLKPYDDVIRKVQFELQSQEGLTSCGALGKIPARKKRSNNHESPQPIRYPDMENPHDDDDSSAASTVELMSNTQM